LQTDGQGSPAGASGQGQFGGPGAGDGKAPHGGNGLDLQFASCLRALGSITEAQPSPQAREKKSSAETYGETE
jgi:hypothetical protein